MYVWECPHQQQSMSWLVFVVWSRDREKRIMQAEGERERKYLLFKLENKNNIQVCEELSKVGQKSKISFVHHMFFNAYHL